MSATPGDDAWVTPLKDLSAHLHSGQAWVSGEQADAAVAAVTIGGDGDVLLWHDWLHGTNNVYELHLAGTSRESVTRQLDAIRAAAPTARTYTAHKRANWHVIEYRDWRAYP